MEKLNNQTIRHILNDISKDIKEVRDMAQLTNGRIKSLEMWRARILGGMSVIIILLAPVVIQYLAKLALAYFE